MPESTERGALTEAVYYIMLVLQTPMHGYCVMQRVSSISDGRVNLCPGTLYGAINTLLQKRWIEDVTNAEDAGRRKEYVLTDLGRQALKYEMDRLRGLIADGEKYNAVNFGDCEA
ncbi:MAG: PadR family transcriptional regulator [Clostridiales bacterium]|nr:PadR family transcriptional regulator [Clostridiales bacterium]